MLPRPDHLGRCRDPHYTFPAHEHDRFIPHYRGLIAAWIDDNIDEAFETMQEHKIRRLPVINSEGELEGVLSMNDVVLPAVEFFTEVPGMARTGFPWAEVAADGSSVIGKHDGTGGQVSIGTVTSQLLYEIGDPAHYLTPDVDVDFTQLRLEQIGPDRVRVSGARGQAPPRMRQQEEEKDGRSRWRGSGL